jgi:RND superfamily putative drug exporter
MSLALYRLGRFAVRRRRLVVGCWLIGVVLVMVLAKSLGGATSDEFKVSGVESQTAYDLLRSRFPEAAGASAQVVFHTPEGTTVDTGNRPTIDATLRRLKAMPGVTDVMGPIANPDKTIALVEVQYREEMEDLGKAGYQRLDAAVQPARDAGVQTELGGPLPQYAEHPEPGGTEGLGLLTAMVILLFAFGSVIAMGLPIGLAIFGVVGGVSFVKLLSAVLPISASGPTLASMIGIGVGIDYALFVVTRHRQHLHEGMTVEESAGRAIATAGQAVIFAGGTVVIAILGLTIVGISMVTGMGLASAIVVAVMVVASITLLPALLGFAGHAVDKLTLPGRRTHHGAAHISGWQRWGHHVARHPWRYLVASLGLLLVLTAPMLSMRLGQVDAGSMTKSSTLRRSYDLVAKGFGPGFNGPLLLAVELPAEGDTAVLRSLADRIAKDPVVDVVAPPHLSPDRATAVVQVIPKSAPQSAETSSLIHRLRDRTIPAATAGTGAKVYVGGMTATFIDLSAKVGARLPWFIGSVVGLSFVLLMMVFRSILVPLKAALMNILSIGAAYGVVVAVFQWGWGRSLIGLDETVPIVSFVPMFMFAILFGLSMDYEVFLLSRVREEYLHTGDNTGSVVVGISSTARVITSAALIMIAVFGGFVFGNDSMVKMMGLGLATAVFVDATIVRVVLVPASMRLLGDANWWLPRWLDRIVPHLDVDGVHGLPDPERVSPPEVEEPEEELLPA